MSAGAPDDTERVIRQLRRKRRRAVQQRRRRAAIACTAAGLALSAALGVAGLTGTDLAGAAAVRADNLMDLIDQRSPGTRTEGQLTKTRHVAMAPAEHLAPPVMLPPEIAQVLSPPTPVEAAISLVPPAPPAMMMFAPSPPGAIFMPPPGGGGGSPPGGGGGPPGGGGSSPPGSPPLTTPLVPGAVPEPGTWMTMLLGFALMGWMLRRQRVFAPIGAAR